MSDTSSFHEKDVAPMSSSYKYNELKDLTINNYLKKQKLKIFFLIFLGLALVLISILSLSIGTYKLSFMDVVKSLFMVNRNTQHHLLIWKMRLPRIIAGIAAGSGLSMAGAIMQTTLKNDLASPSTLGISSAATFGANLSIIVFASSSFFNFPYATTLMAFVFSVISVIFILSLSKIKKFNPSVIILAGVAINALFQAFSTLIQYFADQVTLSAAIFWTFGDLSRASWQEILILAVIVFIVLIYFIYHAWDYQGISHNDHYSRSLGISVDKLRLISILLASLVTAVSVSFLGMIAFIGLIGPHIVKRIIGKDHRYFIPGSALLGAIILLLADLLSRTIIAPITLPVGAITSFLGATLFLYILLRGQRNI